MLDIQASEIKVALLAGGKSGERSISLASGAGVKSALQELGFQVDQLDPANEDDLVQLIKGSYDVAFLALHGKWGEDGTIQGMLELLNLPYTGSGVYASAVAMDKSKSKVFYDQAGIATPASLTLTKESSISIEEIVAKVGSHAVVKPATEGSALGVHVVEGAQDIEEAIAEVFAIDSICLVESFISGRELTVAVLGNENPQPLPVIEIIPKATFYDFESKYAPGGSEHICPAQIPIQSAQKAQEAAVAAHKVLNCQGVSRSDIILDADGICWVLETNTIPGMTETSLLPDAARSVGMSYPDLCGRLIELALERK